MKRKKVDTEWRWRRKKGRIFFEETDVALGDSGWQNQFATMGKRDGQEASRKEWNDAKNWARIGYFGGGFLGAK